MSRVSISKKAARALESFVGAHIHRAFEGADVAEALAELRQALTPGPSKYISDCQWCGKDILSEPCGPSHRMRQRLALAKKRKKAPDPAGLALAADLKARANATRRAFGLAPLPYPKMVGDREKALRKESRREETAAIREACLKRANGVCECGCGHGLYPASGAETSPFPGHPAAPELDHVFSKGKGARLPQSVETCWILRADCHRERTNNRPDAATWWKKFRSHALSHDYGAAALAASDRLAFVEVRAALPSSPRTRHD